MGPFSSGWSPHRARRVVTLQWTVALSQHSKRRQSENCLSLKRRNDKVHISVPKSCDSVCKLANCELVMTTMLKFQHCSTLKLIRGCCCLDGKENLAGVSEVFPGFSLLWPRGPCGDKRFAFSCHVPMLPEDLSIMVSP